MNKQVTSQKCINYKCQTIKIPLYLKLLDFFDRHYNYKTFVNEITAGVNTQEEKVMQIFDWVSVNLKETPEGFDIVDDHVWHIIVRGYGASDQLCDVFATLCNYIGCDAFFIWIKSDRGKEVISLCFVKIHDKWSIFDPYRGVYFKNEGGSLAKISDIESGDWLPIFAKERVDLDYSSYFYDLPDTSLEKYNRSSIQSPLNRLIYEIEIRKKAN